MTRNEPSAEITWGCAVRTSWSILWRSVFLWFVLLIVAWTVYRVSPAYKAQDVPDVLLRFSQPSSVEGSLAMPFETLERFLIALGLLVPVGFVVAVRSALHKSGFIAPMRSQGPGGQASDMKTQLADRQA